MLREGSANPSIPGTDPGFAKALADAVASQAGGGGSSSRYPGQVYMGPGRTERYMISGGQKTGEGIGAPRYGSRQVGGGWVTGEQAEHDYNDWSEKKRQDFIAQAKIAGLINADGGEAEGANLWRSLVKEASYFGVSKKNKISPWDILSSYVKAKGGAGAVWQKDPSNPDFEINALTGERRYVGPQFKTTTDRRVDFSDPATAAAIATRVFQDLMGRDPGKGELGTFADALHSAEAQNPTFTTTTTEFDGQGQPVSQSSTSQGGMTDAGREYLAQQKVKGTKEYGVVQAVTNYQNVLESAVFGSPTASGG